MSASIRVAGVVYKLPSGLVGEKLDAWVREQPWGKQYEAELAGTSAAPKKAKGE
jgi:hypothetical protein